MRQAKTMIELEDGVYTAHCAELDVASQGDTIESARANLKEAVDLSLETADPTEVEYRRGKFRASLERTAEGGCPHV